MPYDGNADFGRFTTFDLSRIDISKGSSSVLYGLNTMGGAINLITKKFSKELEGSLGYGCETGKNAKTYGNNVDFSIGTKQELFYAQAGGSYMEDAGQQLSRKFDQKVTGNEDGGRRDNSVQRDKKFNIKFATSYKHDKHSGYKIHEMGRLGTEPTVTFIDKTYSFGLENTYKFSEYTKFIVGISYDIRDAVKAEDYIQNRGGGGGGGRNNPANYKLTSFDVGKKHAFNYQAAIKHGFDGEDELSLSFAKNLFC